MKKNRLIYLLLAIGVLIYFLKKGNVDDQQKKKNPAIQSKQSIKKEIHGASEVQTQMFRNVKSSTLKTPFKSMSLQEAYCLLKMLDLKVPMSKRSKFSGYFGPSLLPGPNGDLRTGEPIITMAISDKKCPHNKYSLVKARQKSGKWFIEKIFNCNKVSDEELFSEYGLQYSLSETDQTDPAVLNFAINGYGLFVTACRHGLVLTRLGKYKRNNDGYLENDKGCFLLNKSLKPVKITPGDELEEEQPYCFSGSSQCLAILNKEDLPKFKGKLTGPFEFLIHFRDRTLLQKLLKVPNYFSPSIFSHYNENLTSKDILPSGLSKKSFNSLKEDFECPQIL